MNATYQADLDKDIQDGDLVRIQSGSKPLDGIGRVVDRIDDRGTLYVMVKRLIKYNGVIIKNSSVRNKVRVYDCTKVTMDSLIDEKMKELEIWREHLK